MNIRALRLLFCTLLLCLPSLGVAQVAPSKVQVENVRLQQELDRRVSVRYDLKAEDGVADVIMHYSLDGGATWMPLTSVSGDVGRSVQAGTLRRATWNAVQDLGEQVVPSIRVRVVARCTSLSDKTFLRD